MRTIHAEHGYSVIEVLISTALGTIVMAGVFDVYVSSIKNLKGKTDSVQMQADTKSAMEYMIRELRMAQTAYSTPTITHDDVTPPNSPVTHRDTIAFTRTEAAGFSSSNGNTATTLTDSNQSWQVNKFAQTAAAGSYSVWIKAGTGATSNPAIAYPILSNSTTTLTLQAGWPLPYPDTSSIYFIIRTKAFTLLSSDSTLRYNINGGAYQLLSQNVTAVEFSLANPCNATTMCVNVTMATRSKDPDPQTKTYNTYTMTDTARPRNH